MRVDLSEPECTNCYHCRASGIFPTQASELSNVIGSSPVSSGTVQALGDDSATVGSTSTSSPLLVLRDDSAAVGSTSTSSPLQALGDDSAAAGSTSTSSPLQALGDDSATVGSTSTSSPLLVLRDDSAAVGSTSTSSPLQALRDDAAAVVGSTSTSSPLLVLRDDSAAVGSTSTSSPLQALRDDSAAVGSTSTSSPLQALRDDSAAAVPVQSSSPYLFGLPFPSITSISSGLEQSPARNLFENCTFGRPSQRPAFQSPVHDTSGCCASATPLHSSSPFGSAPSVTSVSSAPTQAFGPTASGFGTFAAPTPSRFESMQDPVKASGPSHNLFKPASSLMFGKLFGEPVAFPRPDIGFSPASSSSTTTVVLGTTPVSVSSPFWPIQASTSSCLPFGSVPTSSSSNLFRPDPSTNASVSSPFGFSPAVTSVSSAPTQAFGPTTSGSGASSSSIASSFLPFGFVSSPPPGGPSIFGPAKNMPWGTNSFSTRCGIEAVRSDVGVFPASSSVFGTTPVSVSSPFGPIQASTSTFLPFGSVPASSLCNSVFGSPPASFSSNLFRPNPSTNASVSSPFGFTPAVTSVSSSPTQGFGPTDYGFGTFAAPTPSRFWSMQAPVQAPFGPAAPIIGFPPKQGSRCPGYAPTPDGQTRKGDIYISISASNPYLDKSHEELRWEDYKQGVKGSGPKAVFSLSTVSPSIFASPSVPDHSQKTNFATTQGKHSGPCFGCGFSPAAVSGTTTFPSGGFSQPNAPSASHDWSRRTEQGSRCPGYAPTPDEQTGKGDIYISISASNPYLYKSHEELRWEDYKQGDKGSRPKAIFPLLTPSIFASQNVPDHSQKTNLGTTQGTFTGPAFGFPPVAVSFSQPNAPFTDGGTYFPSSFSSSSTTFPAVSFSVQRPHETAAVSSPASGCTACGATSSSSASTNFTFNGATSLPVLFYPTSGFCTSSAAQATTPSPVQGYILLPFAAMSLQ